MEESKQLGSTKIVLDSTDSSLALLKKLHNQSRAKTVNLAFALERWRQLRA